MTTDIDTPYLFIVRTPGEINGRLAAQDGKILLIVDNYTEVYAEPPVVTDGNSKVYALVVAPDEVKVYQDGDKHKMLLWTGDKTARTKPQDRLTLPIFTLGEVAAAPVTAANPAELAKAGFVGLPEKVQLAAVISNTADVVLAGLPELSPARAAAIKSWAAATLDEHMAAQVGR